MSKNNFTLNDWQTAIALVTAYEADPGSGLWYDLYQDLPADQIEFIVFALTALCANLTANLATRLDVDPTAILSGLSLTLEEYFSKEE